MRVTKGNRIQIPSIDLEFKEEHGLLHQKKLYPCTYISVLLRYIRKIIRDENRERFVVNAIGGRSLEFLREKLESNKTVHQNHVEV